MFNLSKEQTGKKILSLFLALTFFYPLLTFTSCKTAPEPEPVVQVKKQPVVVKKQTRAVIQADLSSVSDELKDEALNRVINIIAKRIDNLGAGPAKVSLSRRDAKFTILFPKEIPTETINLIAQGSDVVTFHLVDTDASVKVSEDSMRNMETPFDDQGNLRSWVKVPSDCALYEYTELSEDGKVVRNQEVPYVVVKKEVSLAGRHIKSASVMADGMFDSIYVDFTLDGEGTKTFASLTYRNIGKALAVISDGELKSVATIMEAVLEGEVAMLGFSREEIYALQKVLSTGSLDIPLNLLEVKTVIVKQQ